jgi:hypothetical protein
MKKLFTVSIIATGMIGLISFASYSHKKHSDNLLDVEIQRVGQELLDRLDHVETYIRDHECVVIDKKTRTYLDEMPDGSMIPIEQVHNLYDCQIEGEHGNRFLF